MRSRIDAHGRPGYTRGVRGRRGALAAFAAVVCLACAPVHGQAPGPLTGPAAEQAREDVARLVKATAPDRPLWIVFDWTAQEREGRFSGRGVARAQDPYSARLDLFGPRGESYLTAAVVESELRLPPNLAPEMVPPVPVLWAVLGVFLPPTGADLVGVTSNGDDQRIEFARGDERWRFDFVGDRLRSVEWRAGRGERRTVELRGEGPFGLPNEAVYRDWAAFTELNLKLDEVEHVEPFSPDVWDPGAP